MNAKRWSIVTVVVVSIVSVGIYAWPGTQKQIQQGFTPIDVSPWVEVGDGFRILDGYEFLYPDGLEPMHFREGKVNPLVDSQKLVVGNSVSLILLDQSKGARVIASVRDSRNAMHTVGYSDGVLVVFVVLMEQSVVGKGTIFRITGDWGGDGAAVGEWARHE